MTNQPRRTNLRARSWRRGLEPITPQPLPGMEHDDPSVSTRLLEIARGAGDRISPRASGVRVLSAPGHPLPDSAGKYLLVDASGQPVAFAYASPRAAPGAVARDALNASRARERLGEGVGDGVLTSIASGFCAGTSLAVYPLCDPLAATRLRWHLQRPAVRRWALEWLRAVAARTLRSVKDPLEQEARFERPLRAVAALQELDPTIRRDALTALERLRSGAWTPRLVLMHGDFWKGNILVRRASPPGRGARKATGYVVIDWGTCELDGYPLFDLVRITESLAVGSHGLGRELALQLRMLECDPVDVGGYLLAALGHRAMNLEHFPFENFLRMATSCHAAVRSATG